MLLSVIFSTEPLWATLVSGVFLKETMGSNALVGAGVILLACLVAQSEQIVQLVGRGGGKGNKEPLVESEADRGVDDSHTETESEDLDNLSVFDEVDPALESELDSLLGVPTVQEYTLPAGVYVDGSPFAEREGGLHSNDVPAVRVGWFGSMGAE